MRGSSHPVDLTELLSHAEWVRDLARGLVAQAGLEDDVVQETYAAAAEKPPAHGQNPRGWLAQVAKNAARRLGRSEGARSRREISVARPEATASTAELAAKASLQRDVVGHVLELDEPFRSVVLLRFFEDLPPREIAERLGVPVKTVKSRLERAFTKLHARLDREYGNRESWCLALLPLCAGRKLVPVATTGSLVLTTGAWIMKVNTKLALAALFAVAVSIPLWHALSLEAVEPAAPQLAERTAAPRAQPAVEQPVETSTERAALASATLPEEELPTEPEAALATAAPIVIHGRVIDVTGQPVGGVSITRGSKERDFLARSASDGRFEAELEEIADSWWKAGPDSVLLRVEDAEWLTVCESRVKTTNKDKEHLVIVARTSPLEGFVTSTSGTGIAGASVRLASRSAFYGFPFPLDMTRFVDTAVKTTDSGSFRFERFPVLPGLGLSAQESGYEHGSASVDNADNLVQIELTPIGEAEGKYVEGVVLDAGGFPVEAATVKLAEAQTQSDSEGRFRIASNWVAEETPIVAAKAGHLPALLTDFGAFLDLHDGVIAPVELRLGEEPLEMRGHVVDGRGEPLRGWFVSALDETEVSQMRVPVVTAEGLTRQGGPRTVRTDKNGAFELAGFFPRTYTLQTYDKETLLRLETEVRAGDGDIVIEVPDTEMRQAHGRVVSASGDRLPDVQVTLKLDTARGKVGTMFTQGAQVVTGADGAFEFEGVPPNDVFLGCSGESILPTSVHFVAGMDLPLEIVALRRCHFRVELNGTGGPTPTVQILDRDGKNLQINLFRSNGMSAYPWVPLEDGNSEVVSVSEEAAYAILVVDGVELERTEIALDAGEVTVLSL